MQYWINKFRNAIRGAASGIRGPSSYWVHIPAAVAVVILAAWLRCSLWQWCVLLLCIGLVLSLELMNSALEHLAKGLCQERNEEVGKALDAAAGAVLAASLVAAGIGLVVLGSQLLTML